jgi:FtsZ-binding cell division protein ZapB
MFAVVSQVLNLGISVALVPAWAYQLCLQLCYLARLYILCCAPSCHLLTLLSLAWPQAFKAEVEELRGKVVSLGEEKEAAQRSHQAAVEALEAEVERLKQQVRDALHSSWLMGRTLFLKEVCLPTGNPTCRATGNPVPTGNPIQCQVCHDCTV